MSKCPSYLCRNRHGTFYFRLVIPKDLSEYHPHSGREIRRSLKTTNKTIAVRRARTLRVIADMHLDSIRAMSKKKPTLDIGYAEASDAFGNLLKVDYGNDADKEAKVLKELIAQSHALKHQYPNNSAEKEKIFDNLTGTTISQLGEKFLAIKSDRRKLSKKTLEEYDAAYRTLIFVLGDIDIGSLTPERMNHYYDCLTKLPSRRSKKPTYKNKTINELLSMTIPKDSVLQPRTIIKTFERTKSLLTYAVDQQILKANPANAVTTHIDNSHPRQHRMPFTNEELCKIFDPHDYAEKTLHSARGPKQPYRFWLPLIALYTGARLGEICQLNKTDIYKDGESGIWVMSFAEEFDTNTGEKIKTIKNQNSIRVIPISDSLIELGLIEFRASLKNGPLFPELASKNNGSDTAQKWLNIFLKVRGVHQPLIKTFHSLRHTFVNHFSNGKADLKYVGAITGHLSQQEFGVIAELANTYFKGYEPPLLKEEVIDKINYIINLPLPYPDNPYKPVK